MNGRDVAHRLAGMVVGAALTLGVVGLSQAPWRAVTSEDGQVRLAWRFRSAPVEACRRVPAEELARLPAHMRRELVCERALRPWLLEVILDGSVAWTDTARARGARADRPLSVFATLPVGPGPHALAVRFAPLVLPGDTAAAPAPLTHDATVTVGPQRVVLVTRDESATRLVVRER